MALFKSKKLDYPEEKESVLNDELADMNLDDLNLNEEPNSFGRINHALSGEQKRNLPEIQELEMERENFRSGFVPMDQMIPPKMTAPSMQRRSEMPAHPAYPQPQASQPVLFPQRMQRMTTPHIYIKITKYREVMDTVNNLHKGIVEAKKELEEIHEINNEEAHKLRETAEVVLKMEDMLRYLETTFTAPEA